MDISNKPVRPQYKQPEDVSNKPVRPQHKNTEGHEDALNHTKEFPYELPSLRGTQLNRNAAAVESKNVEASSQLPRNDESQAYK